MLAIAAVVDIALHSRLGSGRGQGARGAPQTAAAAFGDVAARPRPRQDPEGCAAGPRGGYELARERRRISQSARIVRTAMSGSAPPIPKISGQTRSRLLEKIIEPSRSPRRRNRFSSNLDAISVEQTSAKTADKAHILDDEKGQRRFRNITSDVFAETFYSPFCAFANRMLPSGRLLKATVRRTFWRGGQ